MGKLTENVNEVLIPVCGNQVWIVRMLTDLCMCCKCLQLGEEIRICCGASSCSYYLTLHQ